MDLAEHILELARTGLRLLADLAKAEADQLEQIPQALGGDPHVVHGADGAVAERLGDERVELGRAHRDDPPRGVLELHRRIE